MINDMKKPQLMKLDLRAPLCFRKTSLEEGDLFLNLGKNGEILICFELNPEQSRSIEPERERLFGSMVFIGQKNEENSIEEEVYLPQGHYLFVQQRSAQVPALALSQTERLDMAIEQQKDGLWERNKLGNLLYVRYLFEDEGFVTQVFRELVV